jgi:hypothetical protein
VARRQVRNLPLMAICKIEGISSVEISPASLESKLENFRLKERYRPNLKNLYVNTKSYFCNKYEVTFDNLETKDLEIIAEAEKLGKGKLRSPARKLTGLNLPQLKKLPLA